MNLVTEFLNKIFQRIFISVTIIPHHFWISSRAVCIMCIEIQLLFHFYWIKFLYEIWDYNNQALFYVNFSDFTPFIRLWIVFLDWFAEICISKSLKSKLTNISYKDMQNLSSPSDCIQFPVSGNERMMISCIIHISDSRNSTVNWSWGIETQTGSGYFITTKYTMIHYLSYKINDFHPPVM